MPVFGSTSMRVANEFMGILVVTNRNRGKMVIPVNTTNEAFYRRFTLPEERKNRV